jgi:hypothetical protein
MPNIVKRTGIAASVLAALSFAGFGVRAEPSMDKPLILDDIKGGVKPAKAAKGDKPAKPLKGAGLNLLDPEFGYGYMEDATTHYSETCFYLFGCRISVVNDPDLPPQKPKIEVRKKAPRPIRHVTDKRTGWTYYLAEDRNTGQLFVQIENASGADVHINGEVPMPGGGPAYPVR